LDPVTAEKIVACLLCKSVDDLAAMCGEAGGSEVLDTRRRAYEFRAHCWRSAV